ncbi:MAG: AMP-binding protein [Treponema sp.]|jgi:acyl-CoA synthetase (AMP-forming)/AMP-acid ligase II|nr:AMP-binding protein [Treponema sp.]
MLINALLLGAFGVTLFLPPTMVYRFAVIGDKSIPGSLGEKRIAAYCRNVTIVWCVFFVFNGTAAVWTIFSRSDTFWPVYNGGISYILMGILFAGEYGIRKMTDKKTPKAVPLSQCRADSRPGESVLCYDGPWNGGGRKTWNDFLEGTAKLRKSIEQTEAETWLLYCEDCWLFLLAFASLLQCKKEIILTANVSPAYIAEIRGGGGPAAGSVPFITDREFPQTAAGVGKSFYIPALLEKYQGAAGEIPAIDAGKTSIVMYTSGSTGTPKAVRQRLTEFENDNRFILSKWGNEFLARKVCSTVSQHHIYGLLFSILLPFTAGVPFRRKRIEFPEEFENLTGTKYMIITVPAFLKRAVEIKAPGSLDLDAPWIFTSGGVLNRETAEKTNEVFGFWPVEVYGSTETSGIAFRQSVNGPEWTPFANALIHKNEDGCLVVKSPYIQDPSGFETADLVDLLEDGRFLLKGRVDSVVKIEGKRISLPEIEKRILQSGLVRDVCVIPMEDKRQYLAAAVVFNGAGTEKFGTKEKQAVNRFWKEYLLEFFEILVIPKKWRYLKAIPSDPQGKKKHDEIKALFAAADGAGAGAAGAIEENVMKKTENSVVLEFSVPQSSGYFDGHFPGFPVLPAAAQVDLVLYFAGRHFGNREVSEIKRIKFTKPVLPGTPLVMRLEKNGTTLLFRISSPDGVEAYCSGTIALLETA